VAPVGCSVAPVGCFDYSMEHYPKLKTDLTVTPAHRSGFDTHHTRSAEQLRAAGAQRRSQTDLRGILADLKHVDSGDAAAGRGRAAGRAEAAGSHAWEKWVVIKQHAAERAEAQGGGAGGAELGGFRSPERMRPAVEPEEVRLAQLSQRAQLLAASRSTVGEGADAEERRLFKQLAAEAR